MHTRDEKMQAFGRILDVLDELREKCPWDRKQTNESLRPQTLEEVAPNHFVACCKCRSLKENKTGAGV